MTRQQHLASAFYRLKAATDTACAALQNDAPTDILKQQLIDAKRLADEAFNNAWLTLEFIDKHGGPFQE